MFMTIITMVHIDSSIFHCPNMFFGKKTEYRGNCIFIVENSFEQENIVNARNSWARYILPNKF